MEEKRLSAGRGILFLTVLGAVSQLLAFGYRVVLSRLAGAQVMGLYQLVMPVYSVLMSVTAVGLTAAASNLTARRLALGDRRGAAQTLSICLRGFLFLIVPVGALVVLASDPISVFLLGDARTRLGLILLVPCTALTGVENLHKHVFYGSGRVRTPAVVELLEQLVRTAAVTALLLLCLPQYPERVLGLIVTGMVLCEVFSACTLSVLYRRRFLSRPLSGPGAAGAVCRRQVWSIALPIGFNSLLGNLLGAANAALIPRQLAAGGMARSQAVSRFGILCGMTVPMLALPTVFLGALTLVLGPKLAQASALGRQQEVRQLVGRAMSVVSVLALPSLALMVVLGADLGRFIFHQERAGDWLAPLALAMAMSCFCSVLACALNSTGHQRAVALISLLGGGVQLLFTLVLTPLPGVELGGYAAGAVISNALELSLCLLTIRRSTGLSMQWFQWLTAPGLAAILSGLCANLLFRVLKDSGLAPGSAGACAALFALVLDLAALRAQGVALGDILRLSPGA